MVDYRGPKPLRQLANHWQVPIFHRAVRLNYAVSRLDDVAIERDALHKLQNLESVSVQHRKQKSLGLAETQEVLAKMPTCRVAHASIHANTLAIHTTHGATELRCPE